MDDWDIFKKYRETINCIEDKHFLFEEAMQIRTQSEDIYEKRAAYSSLGVHYYLTENYNLALKYLKLAADNGSLLVTIWLGDIWYNGYAGEVDYEKAFKYYSATSRFYRQTQLRILDMYRYGHYVEQDYEKYCDTIEQLYENYMLRPPSINEAGVLYRMAEIMESRGELSSAVDTYNRAKYEIITEISEDNNFRKENLELMNDIINNLYRLSDVDYMNFGIYELCYILKQPVKVTFEYNEKQYEIESIKDEDGFGILFDGKWYRDPVEFLYKARIDETLFTELDIGKMHIVE